MATKYLINPLKSCYVVERTYLTKDTWIICAEKKWSKFELISDFYISPGSDYEGAGVKLLEFEFTNEVPPSKNTLNVPNSMNIEEIKLLNKIYKKDGVYGVKSLGWKLLDKTSSIYGSFQTHSLVITNLSFTCNTVELMSNNLSNKEFIKITKQGLTQEEYYEAREDCTNEYFGPTEIDFDLKADENLINGSNIFLNNLLNEALSNLKIRTKKQNLKHNKNMIVFEQTNRSTVYELEIKEEFDKNKLSIEISSSYFGGISSPVNTINVLYDGDVFGDTDSGFAKYADEYLLDDKGQRHGFDISDEEDEEDEEE